MGCGCRGRDKEYSSTDKFRDDARKIAKKMAVFEGVCYVVLQRPDCSYTFMPEASFKNDGTATNVEYLSPMPYHAAV
jgi:Fe-S oxidoreductase